MHEQRPRKRRLSWRKIDWPVVIGITAIHLAALAAVVPPLAPLLFSWSAVLMAGLLAFVTGCLGITLCYHRLLTHRSFKTPQWFEYTLTIVGTLAWQGGPVQWVGNHRLHHRHSDTEEDPHTPRQGFDWAHMLWTMEKNPENAAAAQDLLRDPVHRVIDRFFWVFQFALIPILFAGGWACQYFLHWQTSGLSWVVWGIGVRTAMVYHGTWLINSACHTWGSRNFETRDRSTNIWWLTLLTFGEAWHNNHHAHQRSARHGLTWREPDPTWWVISLLAYVGLAWDIVGHKRAHELE